MKDIPLQLHTSNGVHWEVTAGYIEHIGGNSSSPFGWLDRLVKESGIILHDHMWMYVRCERQSV